MSCMSPLMSTKNSFPYLERLPCVSLRFSMTCGKLNCSILPSQAKTTCNVRCDIGKHLSLGLFKNMQFQRKRLTPLWRSLKELDSIYELPAIFTTTRGRCWNNNSVTRTFGRVGGQRCGPARHSTGRCAMNRHSEQDKK